MRERIFKSVLLPAPLRPMMPTTSPGGTARLTSRSAQMLVSVERAPERRRLKGARALVINDSRSVPYWAFAPPMRYRLLNPSTVMIGSMRWLNYVGERFLHPAKRVCGIDEDGHGNRGREAECSPVECSTKQAGAKGLDDSGQRVEPQQPAPLRGQQARR